MPMLKPLLSPVMLFGDFGANKGEEVADPYYGGQTGFDKNFEQVVSMFLGESQLEGAVGNEHGI